MTLDEKLMFAELLRSWRSWFVDKWVTAEQVIHYLRHLDDRDLLRRLGIASGDHEELNRRLDEVRDKLIYNFVVKRDLPYMQPVRWRVFLQDNRVKLSDEERNDFLSVRREAGSNIAPATAEVRCTWDSMSDPYGVYPDQDSSQNGKVYWARSPGSDIWVEFGYLPDETRAALRNKLEARSRELRP